MEVPQESGGLLPELFRPEHPFLREIVRFITFIDFPAGSPGLYLSLFPNCTTNLSITLKDRVVIGNRQRLANFASTSCLSPMVFDRSHALSILNIQFEPFGLHALLGRPMEAYTNKLPPLEVFFKASALETLYNRVVDAPDMKTVTKAVEDFLLGAYRGSELDPRILTGTRLLQAFSGPDMDELSHTLCLSGRGLRKLFGRYLGISPKRYANLSRFNHAARRIALEPQTSLTQIAYEQGYFDQAHFIREFKQFSGITPGTFRKLPGKSAEFYNFIPEGTITFGMS